MRVLAWDPGSTRMGWAVLDGGSDRELPVYVDSGVFRYPQFMRKEMEYQPYRLMLQEEYFYFNTPRLISEHQPDLVVTETIPPRGAGEAGGVYLLLAQTAVDSVQCACLLEEVPFRQVSASTAQTDLLGKGAKKTKPRVRNEVITLHPELEARRQDWRKEFEEPDAVAVGSSALGYRRMARGMIYSPRKGQG